MSFPAHVTDESRMQSRDVGVFITHLREGPRVMFERGGIVGLLGADAFYQDVGTVMRRLTREARD